MGQREWLHLFQLIIKLLVRSTLVHKMGAFGGRLRSGKWDGLQSITS